MGSVRVGFGAFRSAATTILDTLCLVNCSNGMWYDFVTQCHDIHPQLATPYLIYCI